MYIYWGPLIPQITLKNESIVILWHTPEILAAKNKTKLEWTQLQGVSIKKQIFRNNNKTHFEEKEGGEMSFITYQKMGDPSQTPCSLKYRGPQWEPAVCGWPYVVGDVPSTVTLS